jgi:hypothetical protein
LAFAAVSRNPHPIGVVLDVPDMASVLKFSVTGVPKLAILIGVEVSAEAIWINFTTDKGTINMPSKLMVRINLRLEKKVDVLR